MKKMIREYGEALLYVAVGTVLTGYFINLLNFVSAY